MKSSTDALVRAVTLLVAGGDTAKAESLLPWVYDCRESTIARAKAFVPPTEGEVAIFCQENGITSVSPSKFVAFYSSKGWMVGKTKMKDWKAAVRGWSERERTSSRQPLQDQPSDYWPDLPF
jgi:hypothetical protein